MFTFLKNLQFKTLINLGFLLSSSISLAAEGAASSKPSGFEQIIPFLIIGLIFYFLLIRPQQKKYKQQGAFLNQIKRGDEVLTNSGIFGRIEGITDQFIILEIAEDTKIRILKTQIASLANQETSDKKSST